eukprot:Gb_37946 [translate_table: standard]
MGEKRKRYESAHGVAGCSTESALQALSVVVRYIDTQFVHTSKADFKSVVQTLTGPQNRNLCPQFSNGKNFKSAKSHFPCIFNPIKFSNDLQITDDHRHVQPVEDEKKMARNEIEVMPCEWNKWGFDGVEAESELSMSMGVPNLDANPLEDLDMVTDSLWLYV